MDIFLYVRILRCVIIREYQHH